MNARPSSPTPAQIPRRSAVTRPSVLSSFQSIVLPPGKDGSAAERSPPRSPQRLHHYALSVPSHDFPAVRLHIVTGKGGTGKSTVAAALALALASTGRNVLLCEVEGRQGIARMFDVEPLPYAERRIATGLVGPKGERGGVVHALHIDPESALLEYLSMYYKLGRAGKALDRFGVIEFATTIAPGVRDVLLTGKVYEATRRNARNRTPSPTTPSCSTRRPTGRIAQFLGVNDELAGLARMGPIKSQADSVTRLFRSPQTACHLVTVLEEMPVQETADGIAELRRHRHPGRWRSSSTRCGRATSTTDDLTAIRAEQGPQEAGCRPT